MAVNLLRRFSEELAGPMADQAARHWNEPEPAVQKALAGLAPALLGALAEKARTRAGAEQLLDRLGPGGYDGSRLEDVASHFAPSALEASPSETRELVDALLGGKQGALADRIANFAGIRPGSSAKLLPLAATGLMSLIGRLVQHQDLDTGGLMNMLSAQAPFIRSSLPTELKGVDSLLDFKGELSSPRPRPLRRDPSEGGRPARRRNWLPWLVLALIVVIGAYYFLPEDGPWVPGPQEVRPDQVATPPATDAPLPPQDTTREAGNVPETAPEVQPIGIRIERALDAGLTGADTTLAFASGDFAAGSAVLSQELESELQDLARVLAARPDLSLRLTAYAPDDRSLGEARARAMAVFLLAQGGIEARRVETAGEAADPGEDGWVEARLRTR